MTSHDWRVRIDDIIEAVEKIDRYLAGLTIQSFVADERTVDAVLRNFEIVGEAARYVPADVQARFPAIPWPRMRAMRNISFTPIAQSIWASSGTPPATICPNCRRYSVKSPSVSRDRARCREDRWFRTRSSTIRRRRLDLPPVRPLVRYALQALCD